MHSENNGNGNGCNGVHSRRLLSCLIGNHPRLFPSSSEGRVIGVLDGNGIGPEVIGAALQVLSAAEEALGVSFEIRRLGAVKEENGMGSGKALSESLLKFCREIFDAGGAILNGPVGGRYVYDLRHHFDLFCKFVPVRPWPELARAGRLAADNLRRVDLLLVRDNAGGVYQGRWENRVTPEGRIAEHSFAYSEAQVARLVEVAAHAAASRRGQLHIVVKEGGVPGISALWREVGLDVAKKHSIRAAIVNVDLAAYQLIQHADQFDVLVAPNLIGDILADIAGVLVASRGLTFSGNYNAEGCGVYQTNHGCAHDLAGTDTANPAGQILSLAMMLRETFALPEGAALIENALASAWRQGWRTPDIAEPGCHVVGTRAMADRVTEQVLRLSKAGVHETRAVAG